MAAEAAFRRACLEAVVVGASHPERPASRLGATVAGEEVAALL